MMRLHNCYALHLLPEHMHCLNAHPQLLAPSVGPSRCTAKRPIFVSLIFIKLKFFLLSLSSIHAPCLSVEGTLYFGFRQYCAPGQVNNCLDPQNPTQSNIYIFSCTSSTASSVLLLLPWWQYRRLMSLRTLAPSLQHNRRSNMSVVVFERLRLCARMAKVAKGLRLCLSKALHLRRHSTNRTSSVPCAHHVAVPLYSTE